MDTESATINLHREVLDLLEQDCLCMEAWEALLKIINEKKDSQSRLSLLIIIDGVLNIKIHRLKPTKGFVEHLKRVVRSYNDPMLLQELGVLYRDELNLSRVASALADRAKSLKTPKIAIRSPTPKEKDVEAVTVLGADSQRVSKTVFRKTAQIGVYTRNYLPPKADDQSHLQLTGTGTIWAAALQAIQSRKCPVAHDLLHKLSGDLIPSEQLWDAWTDLGEAWLESHNCSKAVEAYNCAFLLLPQSMLSCFNLATALLYVGKLEEALKRLEEANFYGRDNPKVWCNIGSVYFLQEQYGRAAASLRKCVQIKPDYFRAWNNLTSALGASGDLTGALEACKRAFALNPGVVEIKFKLGLIYYYKGEWNHAITHLLDSLVLPDFDRFTHAFLCMSFCKIGDLEKAQTALNEAIRYMTDSHLLAEVWSILGHLYAKKNFLAESKAAHMESVHLNSESGGYWKNLALAHQALGEKEESRACMVRISYLERSKIFADR